MIAKPKTCERCARGRRLVSVRWTSKLLCPVCDQVRMCTRCLSAFKEVCPRCMIPPTNDDEYAGHLWTTRRKPLAESDIKPEWFLLACSEVANVEPHKDKTIIRRSTDESLSVRRV